MTTKLQNNQKRSGIKREKSIHRPYTRKKDITSLVYLKTAHRIKRHNQTIIHDNGAIGTPNEGQ